MEKRSITSEDYLKLIDEYTIYNGYTTLTDISNYLNITRQSAYDEINLLIKSNIVEKKGKGQYVLTEEGEREANIFLRKHRIAEIILYNCLDMPWNEIDDEAMGIEHGITEKIEESVYSKYNCSKCPHGNPIPDKNGNVTEPDDIQYKDLQNNNKYIVSRIVFENKDILNFLGKYNIIPGKTVEKIDGKLIFDKIIIPEYISRAMRYFY